MSPSRRRLLRGAGAALVALPSWTRLGVAAEGIAVTPVADSLAMLTGTGGNVLVLTTGEGQVLVDSGAAADRDALLATLGGLPGDAGKERRRSVAALFNTHWHPDQVGANESLGASGARIFAHEKTRQRLAAGYYRPEEDDYVAPLAPSGLPTETTYDSASVDIGGRRIDYGYLIEAHTDGDVFVGFPDLNVIAAGDAVSPARDPELDWYGGGWLGGRLDSIALLLDISDADTRFVPSFGPVVGRSEVQAEHEMLLALFDRLVERLRLGETPADMLANGVLDGLGRDFDDPGRFLYDLQKGFWAHHNALMHDIV